MYACLHCPGNLALLLECARHFSPLIEETSPDTVVFDARGLRLIFGAPEHIAAEMNRLLGLSANIALASNPDAAMHAARGMQGITIIPPGREAAMLAKLPLYLLGGSSELAATLDAWGIRTFGELAALPPMGVAARLGDEGLDMQRLARGEGARMLRLRGDPLEFQEEMELEDPVGLLEPLLFLLSQMLGNLCGRLRAHSLTANEIHLLLKLERAPIHIATLRLPTPMLDVKVFLKLLQLELSDRPPQAAVERIQIKLTPVQPRTTQHGLFLPPSPEPEKLEITLARIRSLVGAASVGAPELLDTHRPDSVRMGTLLLAKPQSLMAARPRLALRRYRPPQSAQVFSDAEGRPAKIFSSKAEGRVIASAGPWRTSGDWWTGEKWDREEWDLEISSGSLLQGSLLCVHRDRRAERWFLDGSYD
jgi:protein ImuB